MTKVATLLNVHRQLHDWSCSASAHEFIAKLHGKLNETEFPLQNDPASHKGGFQFEAFLNGVGFTGHDNHLLPQDALNTFAEEDAEGRFPLVSIIAGLGTQHAYWHIAVAIPFEGDVILVDPAKQDFITHDSGETLRLLRAISAAVRGRDKIHFLTYREK